MTGWFTGNRPAILYSLFWILFLAEIDFHVFRDAAQDVIAAVRVLKDRAGHQRVDGAVGHEAGDEALPGHCHAAAVAVEPERAVPRAEDLARADRRRLGRHPGPVARERVQRDLHDG